MERMENKTQENILHAFDISIMPKKNCIKVTQNKAFFPPFTSVSEELHHEKKRVDE